MSIDSAFKVDELLAVLASLGGVDFRGELVWLQGDITCLGVEVWNARHSMFDAGGTFTVRFSLRIGAVLDGVTSLASRCNGCCERTLSSRSWRVF